MRARRIDPDIRRRVEELLVLGFSPSRVLSRLQADEGLRDRVPSLRTIESMRADLRAGDRSERWHVGGVDPDEAALVLPVLAELIEAGQMTSITRETGRWIATVRRILPELPAVDVLLYAARYQATVAAGRSTHVLDVELARRLTERRPPG